MAGIAIVPDQEKRNTPSRNNLTWTINRAYREGDIFSGAGHRIQVKLILECRPDYNIAVVSVLEPEGNAPPLRFTGEFDSSTRTADNAFRGQAPR